jgi:hypothetical protein
MSATKNNAKPAKPSARSASDRGLLGSIANQLRQRLSAIVALVAVAGIAWAAMLLWQRVRSHVAIQPEYRLDAAEIQITPPPPWIRADVRAEALHNAGLTGSMSILDDDLIERIHKAFLLHPWVAQVSRVSKRHPAHVDVELVYRRPVAMVAVPGGLYPVDVDGVLLPTDDFTKADAQAYPRLAGVESTPLGMPGSPWGDTVVAGGAKIADALAPIWVESRLSAIRWAKPAAGANPATPAAYDLLTGNGATIPWGAAPGSEPTGEPKQAEKVARLKQAIAEYGTLDAAAAATSLDLRQLPPPSTPRTAAR